MMLPVAAAVLAEALSSSSEIAHLRERVASLEAALARSESPLRAEAGALFSSLQIASLDAKTGAVEMPDNTTHILMEIGCNTSTGERTRNLHIPWPLANLPSILGSSRCSDLDTLDDQALHADHSAFLLAFEPLVT